MNEDVEFSNYLVLVICCYEGTQFQCFQFLDFLREFGNLDFTRDRYIFKDE